MMVKEKQVKKLVKIRLIHWHYFANSTIEIRNNVLVTGQNATGKSTILDAVSFVLTAGEQYFNLAANEKGKRDLRGYVKCKLGTDDREYIRPGDVTGHIALEFYEEKKDTYFTVGAVIDAFGEITPPKVMFYILEDQITDKLFIDDEGKILSTVNFRKNNQLSECFLTKKETKRGFRQRFGSINERYFTLIPKALAFKPIPDVKQFIYQHLLTEKKIEVESIQESIRAYKDLERTLKQIKRRITDLESMKNFYADINSYQEQKAIYEYLIKLIEQEHILSQIDKKSDEITKLGHALEKKNTEARELEEESDALDERSKEVYAKLINQEDFQNSEVVDKQIVRFRQNQTDLEAKLKSFIGKISNISAIGKDLKKHTGKKIYDDLIKIESLNFSHETVDKSVSFLVDLQQKLKLITSDLHKYQGSLETNREDQLRKINEMRTTLRLLEGKSLRYSDDLMFLKREIETHLRNKYNKDISVNILAELLEVTDPVWHNTVEDFLGNQRFNLIVDPRYFDDALFVFDKLKHQRSFLGTGLVNTKQITKYNSCEPKSLASIITSENVDAKRYINMTVGHIIMCDSYSDLERYTASITCDGFVYQRYTIRMLNRRTEKPFIGKNALEAQSDNWRKLAESLKEEYTANQKLIDEAVIEINDLSQINLHDLIINAAVFSQSEKNAQQLKELVERKNNLSKKDPSTHEEEYERLKKEIQELNAGRALLFEEIGRIKTNIEKGHLTVSELKVELEKASKFMQDITEENLIISEKAKTLLADQMKTGKDRGKIFSEYQRLIQVELDNLQAIEENLKTLQFKYNNEYNSGFGIGLEAMVKYLSELDKLVRSELVNYESKVREAREDSERVFKEDFLSKLRDYIITAQEEIKGINDALHNIRFGEDGYEFVFPKSKEYAAFYEMIINEENSLGKETIFTYDFEQKYQKELAELFDELSADEVNSHGKALEKFMDYRTYMDYDIKIIKKNDEFILYSRVFKEKSGGETQVPFYVAILASFVQIYQAAERTVHGEAVNLVLFDEVFDKMDSGRTKAMMQFINSMPVQIMLATPPHRMSDLQPFTDTVLAVSRVNDRAQVLDVTRKEEVKNVA